MALLQLSNAQPFQSASHASLTEHNYIISPLVHSLEQPINNMISESRQVVSGLGTAIGGVTRMVPYFLGGWLVWTAVGMYFPDEMRMIERSVGRASKRMRLY